MAALVYCGDDAAGRCWGDAHYTARFAPPSLAYRRASFLVTKPAAHWAALTPADCLLSGMAGLAIDRKRFHDEAFRIYRHACPDSTSFLAMAIGLSWLSSAMATFVLFSALSAGGAWPMLHIGSCFAATSVAGADGADMPQLARFDLMRTHRWLQPLHRPGRSYDAPRRLLRCDDAAHFDIYAIAPGFDFHFRAIYDSMMPARRCAHDIAAAAAWFRDCCALWWCHYLHGAVTPLSPPAASTKALLRRQPQRSSDARPVPMHFSIDYGLRTLRSNWLPATLGHCRLRDEEIVLACAGDTIARAITPIEMAWLVTGRCARGRLRQVPNDGFLHLTASRRDFGAMIIYCHWWFCLARKPSRCRKFLLAVHAPCHICMPGMEVHLRLCCWAHFGKKRHAHYAIIDFSLALSNAQIRPAISSLVYLFTICTILPVSWESRCTHHFYGRRRRNVMIRRLDDARAFTQISYSINITCGRDVMIITSMPSRFCCNAYMMMKTFSAPTCYSLWSRDCHIQLTWLFSYAFLLWALPVLLLRALLMILLDDS